MKKFLLITLFAVFFMNTKAQITFEYTYDTAGAIFPGINQLMVVNFEVSGERYIRVNRVTKTICLYDMNHSLLKTISLASFPMNGNGTMGDVMYLSEKLFDIDSSIEFMYITQNNNTYFYTQIIKLPPTNVGGFNNVSKC